VRVDTLEVARESFRLTHGRLSRGDAGWTLATTIRYDRARPVVVLAPILEVNSDTMPATLQYDVADPRQPSRILGELGRDGSRCGSSRAPPSVRGNSRPDSERRSWTTRSLRSTCSRRGGGVGALHADSHLPAGPPARSRPDQRPRTWFDHTEQGSARLRHITLGAEVRRRSMCGSTKTAADEGRNPVPTAHRRASRRQLTLLR